MKLKNKILNVVLINYLLALGSIANSLLAVFIAFKLYFMYDNVSAQHLSSLKVINYFQISHIAIVIFIFIVLRVYGIKYTSKKMNLVIMYIFLMSLIMYILIIYVPEFFPTIIASTILIFTSIWVWLISSIIKAFKNKDTLWKVSE